MHDFFVEQELPIVHEHTMGQRLTLEGGYFEGQVLIAMPGMEDARFVRSVVYVCAHSSEGAMGLVINQRRDDVSLPKLLVQLSIIDEDDMIRLPASAERLSVMHGGPVEGDRGFVLHSADYFVGNATLPINQDVCLTATLDILRAIAAGRGPRRSLLALGYANWGPGQLDNELQQNGWLTCAADSKLLFDAPVNRRYDLALARLGVNAASLSSRAGHA